MKSFQQPKSKLSWSRMNWLTLRILALRVLDEFFDIRDLFRLWSIQRWLSAPRLQSIIVWLWHRTMMKSAFRWWLTACPSSKYCKSSVRANLILSPVQFWAAFTENIAWGFEHGKTYVIFFSSSFLIYEDFLLTSVFSKRSHKIKYVLEWNVGASLPCFTTWTFASSSLGSIASPMNSIRILSTVVPVSSTGCLCGSLMPFIVFSLLHRVRKLLGQMWQGKWRDISWRPQMLGSQHNPLRQTYVHRLASASEANVETHLPILLSVSHRCVKVISTRPSSIGRSRTTIWNELIALPRQPTPDQ